MKLVQSELYVNIIQHDGPYWKVNNSWGFRGYKGGNELFTLLNIPHLMQAILQLNIKLL